MRNTAMIRSKVFLTLLLWSWLWATPPGCDGAMGENAMMFYNLYKSVMRGSKILRDITDGAGAVTDAMRAIDDFMDGKEPGPEGVGMAGSVPCDDTMPGNTCPAAPLSEALPEDVPLPDLTHTTACGALGFHLRDASLPISEMTECCNVHGACYGAACRSNKRTCDKQLRKCLTAVCKSDKSLDRALKKSCRAAAKLLFTGTMSMSFMQYKKAQELLLCRKRD